MKKYLVIILMLLCGAALFAQSSYAFSSVMGAKTFVEELRIDGIKVENPSKVITIANDKPTFSGYSHPNIKLILNLNNKEIQRETLTDTGGYWSYTLNKSLPEDTYILSIHSVDRDGNIGDVRKSATFQIIDTGTTISSTGAVLATSLTVPNYLSYSLLLLFISFILFLFYIFMRKKSKEQK